MSDAVGEGANMVQNALWFETIYFHLFLHLFNKKNTFTGADRASHCPRTIAVSLNGVKTSRDRYTRLQRLECII